MPPGSHRDCQVECRPRRVTATVLLVGDYQPRTGRSLRCSRRAPGRRLGQLDMARPGRIGPSPGPRAAAGQGLITGSAAPETFQVNGGRMMSLVRRVRVPADELNFLTRTLTVRDFSQ